MAETRIFQSELDTLAPHEENPGVRTLRVLLHGEQRTGSSTKERVLERTQADFPAGPQPTQVRWNSLILEQIERW